MKSVATKSARQLKIGETIKRAISDIFLREDILTFSGNYITVLEADVSPDAKNVKIFLDIFGDDKTHDKIIIKLNEMVPFFRHQIAKRISLKTTPEIIFILDKTNDKASLIEKLIENEAKKYRSDGSKNNVLEDVLKIQMTDTPKNQKPADNQLAVNQKKSKKTNQKNFRAKNKIKTNTKNSSKANSKGKSKTKLNLKIKNKGKKK
jgi:ribosome-binding factor A